MLYIEAQTPEGKWGIIILLLDFRHTLAACSIAVVAHSYMIVLVAIIEEVLPHS